MQRSCLVLQTSTSVAEALSFQEQREDFTLKAVMSQNES